MVVEEWKRKDRGKKGGEGTKNSILIKNGRECVKSCFVC